MRRAFFLVPLGLAACRCGEETGAVADSVAECVRAEGDVRFHPPREVVWQSVNQGHRFALGDWVRTAEAARASIRFDSGSVVELDPVSTVIIETTGDDKDSSLGPLIALESGSLRGSSEKGVSRRVSLRTPGGERVSLAPEKAGESFDYRVSVRGSGEVELAVTSGAAEISSGAARSVLRAGEARVMTKGRFSEAERLLAAPDLASPAHAAQITVERGRPVKLTWVGVDGAARYRAEVSKDTNFRGSVQSAEVDETSWATVLDAGTYHWRVSSVSKSGVVGVSSVVGTFEVIERVVLEHLLAPADAIEVEWVRRRTRIEFVWTPWPGAAGYELVVSRDPSLSKPVLDRSLTETRVVITELGPGQYHWGVFAQDPDRTPLFRVPFRLRVKKGAATLEAPNKLDWR